MKKTWIILLILAAGLFAYKPLTAFLNRSQAVKNSVQVKKIGVQQKISGQADFSRQQIEEGRTALDLLKQSASPVTVGEKENAFVVGINGIKAEEEKQEFWSFYLNGKPSPVGAGSYQLKDGDKIEWKIEKY